MDPDAAYRDMFRHYDNGCWADALESARGLRAWLMRDGYPPANMAPDDVARDIDEIITVCRFSITKG